MRAHDGCSPWCSVCLAWYLLTAFGVVVSVEIDVVNTERLYPRALLTSFHGHVDLTRRSTRLHRRRATQRHKGFESVDVPFDYEGQEASAWKRADNDVAAYGSEIVRDEDI